MDVHQIASRFAVGSGVEKDLTSLLVKGFFHSGAEPAKQGPKGHEEIRRVSGSGVVADDGISE